MRKYNEPITKAQKIGFKILSSILIFDKSIRRKVNPPLTAINTILLKSKAGSNIEMIPKPIPKEARNPAIYPIMVFSDDLGNLNLPNLSPNTDAAPSPIVAISIADANIQNGKKMIGTNERAKTVGLMNSKFSLYFIDLPKIFKTLLGIR